MAETKVVGTFESAMSRIIKERARKKEEGRITQMRVDEVAEQRFKFENATPEERRAMIRAMNVSNLANARVRGTFKLLESMGPEYDPTSNPKYDEVVRRRIKGQVGDVIMIALDMTKKDVDAMMQFAVTVGDMSVDEFYGRQPSTCSKEDIEDIVRMKKEGYQCAEIVFTLFNRGVRVSQEIIAHPEKFIDVE